MFTMDDECVNPRCGYLVKSEVCTKCGAVQDTKQFIISLQKELDSCYSEIKDKESLIEDLHRTIQDAYQCGIDAVVNSL